MAQIKKVISKHIQLHDFTKNWENATSFTPEKGRIIVYDPDPNPRENTEDDIQRFKIGDGTNTLPNLPFFYPGKSTGELPEGFQESFESLQDTVSSNSQNIESLQDTVSSNINPKLEKLTDFKSEGFSTTYNFNNECGWKRILYTIRGVSGTIAIAFGSSRCTMQTLGIEFGGFVNYPGVTQNQFPLIHQKYAKFFGGKPGFTDPYYNGKITKVRIGYPRPDTTFPTSANAQGDTRVNNYTSNPVNCYVDIYTEYTSEHYGIRNIALDYAGKTEQNNLVIINSELDNSNVKFFNELTDEWVREFNGQTASLDYGMYGEELDFYTIDINDNISDNAPDDISVRKEVYAESFKKEIKGIVEENKLNNIENKILTTPPYAGSFFRKYNLLGLCDKSRFGDSKNVHLTVGDHSYNFSSSEETTDLPGTFTINIDDSGVFSFEYNCPSVPWYFSKRALSFLYDNDQNNEGIVIPAGKYVTNISAFKLEAGNAESAAHMMLQGQKDYNDRYNYVLNQGCLPQSIIDLKEDLTIYDAYIYIKSNTINDSGKLDNYYLPFVPFICPLMDNDTTVIYSHEGEPSVEYGENVISHTTAPAYMENLMYMDIQGEIVDIITTEVDVWNGDDGNPEYTLTTIIKKIVCEDILGSRLSIYCKTQNNLTINEYITADKLSIGDIIFIKRDYTTTSICKYNTIKQSGFIYNIIKPKCINNYNRFGVEINGQITRDIKEVYPLYPVVGFVADQINQLSGNNPYYAHVLNDESKINPYTTWTDLGTHQSDTVYYKEYIDYTETIKDLTLNSLKTKLVKEDIIESMNDTNQNKNSHLTMHDSYEIDSEYLGRLQFNSRINLLQKGGDSIMNMDAVSLANYPDLNVTYNGLYYTVRNDTDAAITISNFNNSLKDGSGVIQNNNALVMYAYSGMTSSSVSNIKCTNNTVNQPFYVEPGNYYMSNIGLFNYKGSYSSSIGFRVTNNSAGTDSKTISANASINVKQVYPFGGAKVQFQAATIPANDEKYFVPLLIKKEGIFENVASHEIDIVSKTITFYDSTEKIITILHLSDVQPMLRKSITPTKVEDINEIFKSYNVKDASFLPEAGTLTITSSGTTTVPGGYISAYGNSTIDEITCIDSIDVEYKPVIATATKPTFKGDYIWLNTGADFIVERGSVDGWYFTKWESGYCELYTSNTQYQTMPIEVINPVILTTSTGVEVKGQWK